MVGRLLGGFAVLVLVALVLGAAFLSWRVWAARRDTPALLREIERTAVVRLGDFPPDRVAMLLAVEDPSFRTHDGIDNRSPGQGRTTLSQSLGKLIYFEDFTPPKDKLELLLVTRFGLEKAAGKDRILEAFLNRAYLGESAGGPVIGVNEAARRYYGVGWRALSEDQYLGLIAMMVSPNTLAPDRYPDANAERVRRIRRLLAGECRPAGLTDVFYEGCALQRRKPLVR